MSQPIPKLKASATNCGLFEVGFFSHVAPLTPEYEEQLRTVLKTLVAETRGGLFASLTPNQDRFYGAMLKECGFKPVMVFTNKGGSRDITLYVYGGENGVYPGYQGV